MARPIEYKYKASTILFYTVIIAIRVATSPTREFARGSSITTSYNFKHISNIQYSLKYQKYFEMRGIFKTYFKYHRYKN